VSLRRLQVTDFRCLQSATLEFDPRFTLISGPNASGKTSLLEAIYILGRGRSFRTRNNNHLVRRGAERFVVFGEVGFGDSRLPLGIEGGGGGVKARVAGERASTLAELALQFPVQIIDPEVHRLIEEGPSRRRRFLDWGVFHVEQEFVRNWQRYHQALRQRNAALKTRQVSTVSPWDRDLLRFGQLVSEARQRYVVALAAQIAPIGSNLLGAELTLSYRTGWLKELAFDAALAQSLKADLEMGATQVGPHRAELGIRLGGLAVKDRISRGQQKLVAAALLIAQINLFPDDAPIRPTLLLDDPAAELDDERLANLIREVSGHEVQLVVTTLHGEFTSFGSPGVRVFIDGGKVSASSGR
jgi:DNA replication and repair protein RecF